MPANLTLSTGTLYAFLLVLARISGALVFVPLPGIRAAAAPARAGLAVTCTIALASRWPVVASGDASVGRMLAWLLGEAALGIAIGVAVALVLEAFAFAAQVF